MSCRKPLIDKMKNMQNPKDTQVELINFQFCLFALITVTTTGPTKNTTRNGLNESAESKWIKHNKPPRDINCQHRTEKFRTFFLLLQVLLRSFITHGWPLGACTPKHGNK